jgi:hypothetical protein
MIKLPISYSQFSKDPVKGLLFLVITAVAYLYIDNKTNLTGQIEKCDQNVVVLTTKIEKLESRLKKSDSILARATVKLEMINSIKGL